MERWVFSGTSGPLDQACDLQPTPLSQSEMGERGTRGGPLVPRPS